jgi:O-antigen/teichoic acid export membrane protein
MAEDQKISRRDLRESTLEGVRWLSVTRLGFELVAAAGAVVLAHLVPPAEYGRFAIAIIVPEIALSLVNEGLGTPLVRRRTLTRRHIEGTLAISVAGGLALTALTVFAAPLITEPLFGQRVTELFRLYAPVFAIAGLMIVPLALLQRRLDFQRIGISELASVAVGTGVSVGLAIKGLDAEAYLLGSLAGIAAWAVTLLIFARLPLPRWHWREAREIAAAGSSAAGAGLAGIGNRNADYVVLGAQLSPAQVGFYYRAFTIGVEYERKISGIVTRIAFPVYSRITDVNRLRLIRRRMVRLNATTIFPLLALFIVVAPVFVPWLFGARWEPAVLPAQILAIAGMATTLKNTIDPLILASGRPRTLMAFNVCELALYVVVLLFASSGGSLVVVCAAVAGFRVCTTIASYVLLLGRVLGSSLMELIGDAGPALGACLALAAAALPVRLALDAPALPTLAACGVVGLAAYATTLRLISPKAWADLLLVARRILPGGRAEAPDRTVEGELRGGVPATAGLGTE